MLHVYFGQDEFRMQEALAALRGELDTDGLLATNTTVLAARGLQPGVLLQHCTTVPFLASARLVVVEGLLTSGSGRDALRTWTPLLEAIPALPPTNHLVLIELLTADSASGFARSGFAKAFREAPGAEVREFRLLRTTGRDAEVVPWVRQRANALGLAIEPRAVEALVEHVGANLRALAGELEKLAGYARGRAINAEDVALLTPDESNTNIFALVDAVVEGRPGQSLVLMRSLLSQRDEEPMRVQAMLARQVRNLVRARDLLDEGAPQNAVAQATGVTSNYPLTKLIQQARAVDETTLEDALRAIEASDHSVKTGEQSDSLALDLLVIRLGELFGARRTEASPRRR